MTGSDTQALLRLLAWLSPAFPVGAFAYSGGLEKAVDDRLVTDATSLRQWAELLAGHGVLWNDAVLFAEAWRGCSDAARLKELGELTEALAGSKERHLETMQLGEAFVAAATAWPHAVFDLLPKPVAYPLAVGAIAGAHGVALQDALAAFLHAAASQLVSAGIRLGVAGQRDGVTILAELEPLLAETAGRAEMTSLDDLGGATIQADIASLRHETQYSRLFRS